MTKQTIEIEVPDGKKAVWKDGKVVFEDVDTMECIKTVDDAIEYLTQEKFSKSDYENNILDSLTVLPKTSYEWKVAAYRAVVAAVTQNEKRHLTNGERWAPTIEFCYPSKIENCRGNDLVGIIKSEGETFYVFSGTVHYGSSQGVGYFNSNNGVGRSAISFESVGSKKAALHISKYFGRLLFEIIYGGTNCNWEWIN